jgi:3-deoxy-D-manno-octulosonate 8-phosphate phosphatase (KDO 8-P phosphatase)
MKPLSALDSARVRPIRALILDVDGVLTDGQILYSSSGEEWKSFNVRDGSALTWWHRVGRLSAFLSGRASPILERRAVELGVGAVEMNAKDKLPALLRILEKLRIAANECAYVGDDLPDLPILRAVGLGLAVADAAIEVKDAAAAVTEYPGGRGAVREVVEFILKAQGQWAVVLERYGPRG